MLKQLSVAVLVALVVACGKDEPRVTVAVSGSDFNRAPIQGTTAQMATIPFRVTNRGSAPAFVTTCGPQVSPVVERLAGSGWVEYVGGFCMLDIISEPTELRNGESQSGIATVMEPGRYRIRALYAEEPTVDPHALSPSDASKAFDVH